MQAQSYKRSADYAEYSMDMDKVYYQRIQRNVNRFTASFTSRKLLDVGCFDGTFASQFGPEWQVFGLEGNVQACQEANKKGVKAVLHDLEKSFPFDNETFDCVIAAEVIEHVYDTDFFLQEIRRVIRKEGVLVMSIPNIACLTNRLSMIFGRYPRYAEYQAGGAGHIRVYTASVIKEQIQNHGFEVISFIGCNFPMPMHNHFIPLWLKRLAVRLGDYFPTIAGQVIITSKKTNRA